MKILPHEEEEFDVGLYDSDTNIPLVTEKAVDVTDECNGEPTILLYSTAERGPLVQIKQGGAMIHYFLETLKNENNSRSNLPRWADRCEMTTEDFIELLEEHAP